MEQKASLKILVATDYSEPSLDAASYALQYAAATAAKLIFLHVYPSTTVAEMAFYEPQFQKQKVEYETWKIKDLQPGLVREQQWILKTWMCITLLLTGQLVILSCIQPKLKRPA